MKQFKYITKIATIALVSFALSGNAIAQPDPDFHIYISVGQSNMEGQGTIENKDLQDINPRYLTMSATDYPRRMRARGEWYPAVPPLCREDLVSGNSLNKGLGPTDYFGRTMVENTPENVRIGVICVAVGGAKIEGFYKDKQTAQDYYNNKCKDYIRDKFWMYDYYAYNHILQLAKKAQESGVIKGILLHQGESNYGESNWPNKVKTFYDNLIADLNLNPNEVPLLVGEVVTNGPSAGMNAIINTVPNVIPNSYVISSLGATEKPNDKIHFNSEGYREMGRRYAAKMLEIEGFGNYNLKPYIDIAEDYLQHSTAPETVRQPLLLAVSNAKNGSITISQLQQAINSFVSSQDAIPAEGHPFNLTWKASTNPTDWTGTTNSYYYYRSGLAAEFYATNCQKQGIIMHQLISGLPDGNYDVVLYAESSFTSGRGFSSPITTEGGNNRSYVFANDVQKMVVVNDIPGEINEPHTFVLEGVKVEDGNLDMGIVHNRAGANWDVIQVKHIARSAEGDHTTLIQELKDAEQRALLFSRSDNLPQAMKQLLAQSTTEAALAGMTSEDIQTRITTVQNNVEEASLMSMEYRQYQINRKHAQDIWNVEQFEEQQEGARNSFSSAMLEADNDVENAISAQLIKQANSKLTDALGNYVANASPTEGYAFDITYLLQNPDITPFQSGQKVPGWNSEQANYEVKSKSDASVISDDGRMTFCQYSNTTAPTSGFTVYQEITLQPGIYKAASLAFAKSTNGSENIYVTFSAGDYDGTLVNFSKLDIAEVRFVVKQTKNIRIGLKAQFENEANLMGIGYLNLYKLAYPTSGIDNAQEWVDVTSDYIINPGFEACTPTAASLTTKFDNNSIDYANEGWQAEITPGGATTGTWSCSAVFEYGSTLTLNGANVPNQDNNGNNGKTLGISVGRSSTIKYKSAKSVTLPPGKYRLSIACINQNAAGNNFQLKLGFITSNGTEIVSNTASIENNTWAEQELTFTLSTPTEGRFQLGGQANANSSVSHAIVFFDNMTLEYIPYICTLIEKANSILPASSVNIGNGLFQHPAEPIDALRHAIQTAEQTYQNFKDGLTDLAAVGQEETNLQNAIDTYSALKDNVNPPAEGQRIKLISTFNFGAFKESLAALTGGTLTMTPHPTQSVPNRYVLAVGPSSNERYENHNYMAQAFIFRPVEGIPAGFTMSLTDEDGIERFVCEGSKVGGNNLQIRTTTEPAKALTLKVIPTDEEGVINLRNTACNIDLGFTDFVAYCWGRAYTGGKSEGFRFVADDCSVNIECNIEKDSYTTTIFPFAITADGTALTQALSDQPMKIYECAGVNDDGGTLLINEVTDIQANKPYILQANDNCNFSLKGFGTAVADKYEKGLLVGNYADDELVPAGCYALLTNNNLQAFYLVDNYSDISLMPYSAYLKYQPAAGKEAKPFLLINKGDGETTGINTAGIDSDSQIIEVYTLSGMRSEEGLVKGVNIVRMADGTVRKIIVSE